MERQAQETSAAICFLCTLKPEALDRDRDELFSPDFQTELPTYTSPYMESWIRHYEPAIHEFKSFWTKWATVNTRKSSVMVRFLSLGNKTQDS